ncbi:MAG: right-handed parallel beta-helix repeat-containing protein [Armatimonadetes bacterium]|nr:right-handed parallel beta-helix repeat-containing protein [Armatimonadota bacterium]
MAVNRLLGPVVACAALLCLLHHTSWSAAGGTYADWERYRADLLRDPTFLRLYVFGTLRPEQLDVPNLGPEDAPLRYSFVKVEGMPDELPTLVDGRFPERKAVRLDRGVLSAKPFAVGPEGFTVAAWLRTHGSGSLHDMPVPTGGTLLSQGSGYYSGWRLTILYPQGQLGFEIGRPNGSFGTSAGIMPDGAWHNLAATWDRNRICIYLDGILVGQAEYAGDYTDPQPAVFRIGYADSGWGSAVMDVDEVAIWRRPLSPIEILRLAYFWAPLSDQLANDIVAAETSYQKREFSRAAEQYKLLTQRLPAPYSALARLRLSLCLIEQHRPIEASQEAAAVITGRDVPEGLRALAAAPLMRAVHSGGASLPREVLETALSLPTISPRDKLIAHLALARSLRTEGKHAEAAKHEQLALSIPDLSPRERLDVRIQLAHGQAASGNLEAARNQYEAVASAPDAPPYYRSYARLCLARAYIRQKKLAQALAELQKIAQMPEAPASHKWEAAEYTKEVERMKSGKPAYDPASHRVSLPERPAPGALFYVSPSGSDANPGTKDRPFATLQRARDAVRTLKQTKGLPKGGIEVRLLPGEYPVRQTLVLDEQDCGTSDAPIVYRAEPLGSARLCGGVAIQGFKPVRDDEILRRLPEEARDRVMAVDLKALGITDLGEMKPHGMHYGAPPTLELFFNGQAMPMARWPNKGFVTVTRVVRQPEENRPAVIEIQQERLKRWTAAPDIWVLGYFTYLWADDSLPARVLDAGAGRVELVARPGYGKVNEGAPCRFFNLLEEIDEPGEWYLDRTTGILYFYPPSDPARADVRISMLEQPFLKMTNVSSVRLEGIAFEYARGDAIIIEGGSDCLLAGCTVRCIGGNGVTVQGGRNHGIFGCDIHCIGGGATRIVGGDRKTLTPGGHFLENCHIYDFSRLKRTYAPSVLLEGVGNRVAHNVIHDSPGHGIRVEGNDHVLEFNEIYRVCMETDDQGGLDIWGNPTYRGNVFRYNFWHDIGDLEYIPPCGRAGIRLDDAISGVLIYGNVFLRCGQANFGAIQIHGGKENVVENNIFVECQYAVSFSRWGADRWKQFLASDWVKRQTQQEVDITKPPYSTKYPDLARLAENADVNMVWRNIVYRCGGFLTRDGGIQELMDNFLTAEDPGFVDADHNDFSLKPDAPVLKAVGFRPIPFRDIGQYEHPLRVK